MKPINFLPDSYRLKTARRRWVARKSVLVVILLMCLACWGHVQHRQTLKLCQQVKSIEAQAQVVRDQQSELSKLREESEFLLNQVIVQRELVQPVSHTQILAVLGRLLPPSVAMLELSMTTKRPPPREEEDDDAASSRHRRGRSARNNQDDEPPPNLIEISFTGLAPDDLTVANLVAGINESPLFVDVRWPYSRPVVTDEGFIGRDFELKMTVPLDCKYNPAAGHKKEVADAG